VTDNVTLKSQVYSYQTKRTWPTAKPIVQPRRRHRHRPPKRLIATASSFPHDQKVYGNVTDLGLEFPDLRHGKPRRGPACRQQQ